MVGEEYEPLRLVKILGACGAPNLPEWVGFHTLGKNDSLKVLMARSR